MPEENSICRRLLSKQLEFYSLQRHDLLNHWQVIMGYLQLGMGDKALNYMKESLKTMEAEQSVGQIPEHTVAAILLSLVIPLRQEGLKIWLEVGSRLKEESFWEENWRQEYEEPFYGYTRESSSQISALRNNLKGLSLKIRLSSDEGFTCGLQLQEQEKVIWESQETYSL